MLRARRAKQEDARFLFELRNEKAVREASLTTAPVLWDAHQMWFANCITSPMRFLYVLEEEGLSVGQVRFDVTSSTDQAEVSISISERFRGRGYGRQALLCAHGEFFAECPAIKQIHAQVKHGNQASLKMFEFAGYKLADASDPSVSRLLFDR